MDCESQYRSVYKGEFAEIQRKLDQLDEAIRGNGKLGILRRLDRLEAFEAVRGRVVWIVFGASLTGAGTVLMKLLGG